MSTATEPFSGFAVFNKAGAPPEVWLYGVVGESAEGVTAKQFRKELDGLGSPKEIVVRINSPGGIVGDGLGIYNSLKRHPARVVVEIDGIALSAAAFVAMAGDEIRMAENALLMIHNAWDVTAGDATELRRKADQLDQWTAGIAAIFAERTKLPKERVAAMMAKETWMDAAEAKALGFADVIASPQKVAAKFDPARFRNVPPKALARLQGGDRVPEASKVSQDRRLVLERHLIRFGKGKVNAG